MKKRFLMVLEVTESQKYSKYVDEEHQWVPKQAISTQNTTKPVFSRLQNGSVLLQTMYVEVWFVVRSSANLYSGLQDRQVAIKFLVALNKHKTKTSKSESVSPLCIWRLNSILRFTHQYMNPKIHQY